MEKAAQLHAGHMKKAWEEDMKFAFLAADVQYHIEKLMDAETWEKVKARSEEIWKSPNSENSMEEKK